MSYGGLQEINDREMYLDGSSPTRGRSGSVAHTRSKWPLWSMDSSTIITYIARGVFEEEEPLKEEEPLEE